MNDPSIRTACTRPESRGRSSISCVNANGYFEDLRHARRDIQVQRDGDGMRVWIADPFSPLPALLDGLTAAAATQTGAPLRIGLVESDVVQRLLARLHERKRRKSDSGPGSHSSDLSARLRQEFDCFANVQLETPTTPAGASSPPSGTCGARPAPVCHKQPKRGAMKAKDYFDRCARILDQRAWRPAQPPGPRGPGTSRRRRSGPPPGS